LVSDGILFSFLTLTKKGLLSITMIMEYHNINTGVKQLGLIEI